MLLNMSVFMWGPPQKFNPSFYHYEQFLPHDKYSYSKTYPLQFIQNQILTPTPLPWKRLYLNFWVHYFHKSHILNELQLIQNMMLVNSKLPKTFEIFTQMSDSVFFPMVPPLHIGWNTDGRLTESGVSFYTILLYFTM